MARIVEADISAVIETDADIDLSPFITIATAFTDKVEECASDLGDPLSADILKEIERYLAAHFYALRDLQYHSKRTERAAATFQGKTGMGLDATLWGQQAKLLDTSGCLDGFGKSTVGLHWGGKAPSNQIEYVDRD